MSYLLTFLAGMQFCLAIVLLMLGQVGAASRCLISACPCLLMAWLFAKRADTGTDSEGAKG